MLLPTIDLLVVVGGAVVVVSAGGVLWSYLRVGSARPAYVREAQFLAGLAVLLAWTVRNRTDRRPGEVVEGADGTAATGPQSWRFRAYNRLAGETTASVNDTVGTDAYLLAIGLVLLALSLGGELLGPLPG